MSDSDDSDDQFNFKSTDNFDLKQEQKETQISNEQHFHLLIYEHQVQLYNLSNFRSQILAIKAGNMLSALIYDKILTSSSIITGNLSEGQMINYLQVDIDHLGFIFFFAPMKLFNSSFSLDNICTWFFNSLFSFCNEFIVFCKF